MSLNAEPIRPGFAARQLNLDTLVSAAAVLPDDESQMEPFIEATLDVLKKHFAYYELLLVDNGLQTEVHARIQDLQSRLPNVRLLRLSRRYDLEVALAAALDHCIGDYMVILDAVQHPPELIPQLVEAAAAGCDSVTALPAGHRENFLDRIAVRPAYTLASRILGFPMEPSDSYYRVFSRRLVNSIVRIRSKKRYLSHLNAAVGLRHGVVSYETQVPQRPEPAFRRLMRHLTTVTSILVSNSGVPLRIASGLGLLACFANFLYLGYILVVTMVKSRLAEGWLTTSLTQTSMFLALFLIMTILSEYIGRILDETKEQPLYFVECETNSTVSEMNRERLNVVHEGAEPPKAGAASV